MRALISWLKDGLLNMHSEEGSSGDASELRVSQIIISDIWGQDFTPLSIWYYGIILLGT